MKAHGAVDRLPALTTLRFFAAFWVVLYHLGPSALHRAPTPVLALVERGWLGVPFFFVLSGFILVHVYGHGLQARTLDRRAFWWARVARIYPMYLLTLAIAFPLLLLRPRIGGIDAVGAGILEVATTLLMLQSWLPWMSIDWNPPAWTLSVEAFFYVAFPLLGVAVVRWRRSPWIAAVGALAVGLVLQVTVLAPVQDPPMWRNFTAAFPPWWLAFFVYGCALGEVRRRMLANGRRVPPAMAWTALAVLLLALAFDPDRHGAASVAVLAAESLFGLVILGFSWPVVGAGWMGSRVGLELGESSYALYLLHLPLASWMGLALGRGALALAPETVGELLAFLGVLVVASVAAHRLIERPVRRALRRYSHVEAPRPTDPGRTG